MLSSQLPRALGGGPGTGVGPTDLSQVSLRGGTAYIPYSFVTGDLGNCVLGVECMFVPWRNLTVSATV